MINVLFLCTGNSARSIIAEALLKHLGQGKFQAFSAGSKPTGTVNPNALEILQRFNIPTAGMCSKSWREYSNPEAPQFDFIFTVCDNAANEQCPVWPGKPITIHWGIPDPAAITGSRLEVMNAFRAAFLELESRIKVFISLPLNKLDNLRLKQELAAIGQLTVEESAAEQ